jgi:hypothetical protein
MEQAGDKQDGEANTCQVQKRVKMFRNKMDACAWVCAADPQQPVDRCEHMVGFCGERGSAVETVDIDKC